MTIKELQKSKLTLRKTVPFRAQVYGNILDGAGKIAKLENRDIEEKDIISICKKGIKNLTSTIELVKEGNIVDAYKKEVQILKEFLPIEVDNVKVVAFVEGIIATLENKSMKDMGKIVGQLKAKFGDSVDMSFASKVIKEKLQE